METTLPFGRKYKGLTLAEVYQRDRNYLNEFANGNEAWSLAMRKRYPEVSEIAKQVLKELDDQSLDQMLPMKLMISSDQRRVIITNVYPEALEQIKALIDQLNQENY